MDTALMAFIVTSKEMGSYRGSKAYRMGRERDMANATSVPRRTFIQGAGMTGTAVALGMAMAGASAGLADELGEQPVGQPDEYDIQVHEADVVIVGGGIAGTTAARRIMAQGLSVAIVDKGPWAHSGTSGINWGHNAESNEWAEGDGSNTFGAWIYMLEGMLNQPNGLAMCQAVHAGRPCATFEQMGCILERGKDGHTAAGNAPADLVVDNGTFNRYFCLDLERRGADIYDRTMVLDLLQDAEGRAAGVVAVSLVDGSAHVFRGKAIVFATGSYCWVTGYNGMKPHTIAGPENTGDGLAILMRKGLAMRDMEELPIDFVQWNPLGIRQGMGAQGASTINWKFMYDKDLNPLVPEGVESVSNGQLARYYYRAQLEGRGTENGGVYVATHDPDSDDRYYRRCKENERIYLGYELPDYTEVVAEQWEVAGHPFDYSPTAETAIPSLFYAASGQGVWAGCGFFGAFGSGFMAGEGAAARALETEDAPAIDWAAANAALAEAYALLESEPDDPLRSTVVFRDIQNAYWSGLSPLRNADGIKGSIAELDRIEKEELPRMYVPQKSRQYNTDWHRALEARNMLMCARATGEAALLREECRGAHVREDFPSEDNENFLKSTKVSYSNGEWSASLEELDGTIMSVEDMKPIMPKLDLFEQ